MESIGDEKRIRALFSEVRFADQQEAPSFTATWHRAQSRAIQPRRAFNLSFVTATALLIFALGGLALWSKYSQPNERTYTASATITADFAITHTGQKAEGDYAPPVVVKSQVRRLKRAVQKESLIVAENRKAEEKAKAQAKELASWQSPTASLLNSPSDNLFKSLPQLNANANEMKSFLPNRANEKEK